MLHFEKENPTWKDCAQVFVDSQRELPGNTLRAYVNATKNLKCPKQTSKFTQWLANPSQEPQDINEDEYKEFENDEIVWKLRKIMKCVY